MITKNNYRIKAYASVMWDIFVLDLLVLCLRVKARQTLLICFH